MKRIPLASYRKFRRIARSVKWRGRALRLAVLTSRVAPRSGRQRRVLCLGDSHLRPMSSATSSQNQYFVFSVSGATASGIRSINSETGALAIFRHALRRSRNVDAVMVALGEIDVGYLAWTRGTVPGMTPTSYLDLAFGRLVQFVQHELEVLGIPIYFVSVSHPTVDCYADWPDEAYAASTSLSLERKLVIASLDDRIELTRYWNAKLEQLCSERGFGWLDLTPASTDVSGNVRPEWNSEHPLDHHLNRDRYSALVDELFAADIRTR